MGKPQMRDSIRTFGEPSVNEHETKQLHLERYLKGFSVDNIISVLLLYDTLFTFSSLLFSVFRKADNVDAAYGDALLAAKYYLTGYPTQWDLFE